MSNLIISRANPFRFVIKSPSSLVPSGLDGIFYKDEPLFGIHENDPYLQKVSLNTYIQMYSVYDTTNVATVRTVDNPGVVVTTLSSVEIEDNYFAFFLDVSELTDKEKYFIRINATDSSLDAAEADSEPFQIDISYSKKVEITYYNFDDAFGMQHVAPYDLAFTIEGQFKEYVPIGENFSFINDKGLISKLSSIQNRGIRLYTGLLPGWMHEKIQLAMAHDFISIDGNQVIATEPYSWEYEEGTSLASGQVVMQVVEDASINRHERSSREKNEFISTWKTDNAGDSADDSITLPLLSTGSYNFDVDYGDGTIKKVTSHDDSNASHQYASTGTYIVKITGQCRGWNFAQTTNNKDPQKITNISKWGSLQITDPTATTNGCFQGCSNLDITAQDALDTSLLTTVDSLFSGCSSLTGTSAVWGWDMSSITSVRRMFFGCNTFNGDITAFDLSSCTTLESMMENCYVFNRAVNAWGVSSTCVSLLDTFQECNIFNQDLDLWDVSGVTNMQNLFYRCYAFNGDVSNWVTTSLTNMKSTFRQCTVFNQSIGSWNVSLVTNFNETFLNCDALNQNLNSWDVSSATNMSSMFLGCHVFNGNITSWVTSSCTNMAAMFEQCDAFNQNIGSWNVGLVTNFSRMFISADTFNQNIGGWNVSSATNMNAMFSNALAFNQSLNSWNVSSVINFTDMFNGALVFNGNLTSWTTTAATTMVRMFAGCTVFDQDISGFDMNGVTSVQLMLSECPAFDQDLTGWDWTTITDATGFLISSTLSTTNYDALLVDIDSQAVQNNIPFHGGNSTYTAAPAAGGTARGNLFTDHSWLFNDGGSV